MQLKNKADVFLPLCDIKVEVGIRDSMAMTKVQQTYVNPVGDGQPLEVKYRFPKVKNAVVSKMLFTIGDRTIDAKIEEKAKAEEKYDDAIAAGNSAFRMCNDREDEELYDIEVGNIQAGQTAVVQIHIVSPLKITAGSYEFSCPLTYFPK